MRAIVRQFARRTPIVAVSSLYETEPVGFKNQPAFLNAVLVIDWDRGHDVLWKLCMDVEADLGRRRSFQNAPRSVDIDILLLDGVVVRQDDLAIPHPRMHERAFVLVPLSEVAPDLEHPVLKQRIRELTDALGDTASEVRIFEEPGWER
jgi:2-amino-4-hydroxy-6-hydroxymethyldihydropteridine diphosphokinase